MTENRDWYAGLSGVTLPVREFDLGEGVRLSQTFAHMMCPFIMAFRPAEPGKHHPAPWRAVNGGFSFDIHVQLHIPEAFDNAEWFDSLNSIWWFVALLRLKASPSVLAPVVATEPFQNAITNEASGQFFPVEADPRFLVTKVKPSILLEQDLAWIREKWRPAGRLLRNNNRFNLLFRAFDQSRFCTEAPLRLLMLWSALEEIFSPARTELRFRVSSNIAAFLEPPGKSRLDLQQAVAKLYDARSTAAHTMSEIPEGPLGETYALVARVLMRIIELDYVPSRDDLEKRLFGVE